MEQTKPTVSVWKLAGPGLVVAATGIGSGDVVSATVGGARYGVLLLWAIAAGAFFKFVLQEGIARWQLATGRTAVEGWAEYLPAWVKWYFGVYLVIWTVAVSASLTNATGLGMANLTNGAISQSWAAVAHSLIGGVLIWIGGYANFETLMKVLVGIMGFSILFCAFFTLQQPMTALRGLLIPTIPPGSGTYVLSLIGGVGGSITMLSYNYWMREEQMRGSGFLSYVRGDIAIAYIFTAIFGGSIMLIANDAFFTAGVTLRDADAVPRMAAALGNVLGPFGRIAFSVGFWAAVFASLLGVWQSVPYLYADLYGIVKKMPLDARREITKVTSTPYRAALAFISIVPILFAFTGQPIQIVIIYTIVSSLFVPFVAATLLYLNNRVKWTEPVPHNSWITNLLLIGILLLFAIVGTLEISNRLGWQLDRLFT
jgi:Mn2+/Fe2+ NRAMP family transporter